MKTRSVRLIGTLHGPIWMPATDAQMAVDTDISGKADLMVNTDGSGLIDAIKSVVDGAGDFQHAQLTADSFVVISHRVADGQRIVTRERVVDVTQLPSLADYVNVDAFTFDD